MIVNAAGSGRGGFLLADDVGLGKTYSTVAAVNEIGEGLNVLVLAPLSVRPHWVRSIQAMGDGGNRWCVTNYDRAKQLLAAPDTAKTAKRTRTKNKRHAAAGVGYVAWDVVILDEAHKLKNPVSQRSAAVRQIVKGHGDPAFVIHLSATAGQNPLELAYLAPLLAEVTGSKVKDLQDFEVWVRSQGFSVRRGPFGQWAWERNEQDLQRMHDLLFTPAEAPNGERVHHALRRRPHDIAGWPEINRVLWPQELDGNQRALYDAALDELRLALGIRIDGTAGDETNPLVVALRFRQKASLLRTESTARFALDLLDDGYQVAISCQFLETAEAIADRVGVARVAMLTGGVSGAEREHARVAFQRGERPVAVFTMCEGISLHAGEQAVQASSAPRVLLLHDIRWSALDVAQIEGRCHRDGENAVVYYGYGAETVEERVAVAVLERLADMAGMLGDDQTGLEALLSAVTP